jgi:hypothetical protein
VWIQSEEKASDGSESTGSRVSRRNGLNEGRRRCEVLYCSVDQTREETV